MTTKEIYKDVLFELNKVNSPTFRLGSFNYFLEKSLLDFSNDSYSKYAVTQIITDDIRALTSIETIDISASYRPLYTEVPYTGIILSGDGKQVTSIIFSSLVYNKYVKANKHLQCTGTYLVCEMGATTTSGSLVTVSVSSVNYDSTKPALSLSDATVTIFDGEYVSSIGANGGIVRQFTLASDDYMHPLGVSCTMEVSKDGTACGTASAVDLYTRGVKRSTFDMQTNIVWNGYLRPSYRNMFYYVYNSAANTTTRIANTSNSTIQNTPVFKIFMGSSRTDVNPIKVEVSYMHLPGSYALTEQQLYTVAEDTSQVLELPDYTKPDIVKRIVLWLMGTESDPRIQLEAQLNTDNRSQEQQQKK